MQLVAYGAQDIYLTGSPQITFFKVVYRRHTNFSLESIEQTFSGAVDFGRKVTCTVSRNGDLLTKAYLKVDLPKLTMKQHGDNPDEALGKALGWCEHVGHRLIKNVEVEIGGQRIDKHYGEWLHVWNELTQTTGHSVGYNRMVGQHASFQNAQIIDGQWQVPAQTMYIPMQFWFNRNPGLALPLIALQYHEVKFNFELAEFTDLCPAARSSGVSATTAGGELTVMADKDDGGFKATLYVDYVYLDADERKRFAQVTHEYLIEQLQHTGFETITPNDGVRKQNVKLSFNHPVKELIWTVKPNFSDALQHKTLDYYKKPFDYALPGAATGYGAAANPGMMDLIYGRKNPIKSALLQLNGHDRFSQRDGFYFNLVQPYQHHENIPATGINCYSFALKPEEHQPSGSCNMSRIDNANLALEVEALPAGGQLYIFATNYNVLRVLSGMGGLAYAS